MRSKFKETESEGSFARVDGVGMGVKVVGKMMKL
jgi:hypothetical protein